MVELQRTLLNRGNVMNDVQQHHLHSQLLGDAGYRVHTSSDPFHQMGYYELQNDPMMKSNGLLPLMPLVLEFGISVGHHEEL
jgi:hypothetical protein